MNSAKQMVSLAQICSRRYCSAAAKPSSHFHQLKSKQAKFQCDDGLPVFLKGGLRDKIMYQGTWILIAVGGGMMVKLFWDLAVPKKQ